MTQFCKQFCGACPACRAALAECKRDDAAYAEAARRDRLNPGGDRTYINLFHKAALDHRGQP